jgi:pyruvate carboxylase
MAANRSEIAVRIFRAGTELGLRTVAVFAHEDRFSIHRYKADEAYQVGQGKGPVAAYLDIESIVGAATEHGIDAIHPGYGFLSENAEFARACQRRRHRLCRSSPGTSGHDGRQNRRPRSGQKINVPVLPGTETPGHRPRRSAPIAKSIGFPLIIKAAFGGGGRGMRVVHKAADLDSLLDEAQGEAGRAFGNSAVFLEKYIPRAKHIEVQILGDQHGNVIHLHERDCSVQRRHQKVVEVAPSFGLPESVVTELCEAAARIAREIRYDNAGTIEFLYDLDRHEWFFIEMNPRIQVEHTVTEVITGLDLVRAQILIAQGHALHSPEVGMPARPTCRATATRSSAASPPRTLKTSSSPTTAASSHTAHPAASACGSTARWASPARSSLRSTTRCWSRHHQRPKLRHRPGRARRTLANSASAASRPTSLSSRTSSPIRRFAPDRRRRR